jgi:phosphate-selective porin OprO/OprP
MRTLTSIVLMLALPMLADAQTVAAKKPPSGYDKVWGNFTDLYTDDGNRVVQRVLLSGRFHYDFAESEADEGDNSEWNVRRLRIGPRINFF